MRYIRLAIVVACIVLLIIIVILEVSQKRAPRQTGEKPTPLPTPTSVPLKTVVKTYPLQVKNVPTLAPAEGAGLDLHSVPIIQSESELLKLYPYLPYSQDFKTSTGVDVSILIPQKEYQKNPWTLTVEIYGLNYHSKPNDQDYASMRQSFQEAVQMIYNWMQDKHVDPNYIIIEWGDLKYIQDESDAWLH